MIAGLLLRSVGLGWGLPPVTPETRASGIRSSYAFDEDNILESLTRTDPANLDFDPKLYHWGTLHIELVLLALEGAQAFGLFEHPWRESFREMAPSDFERIYVTGRLVSVVADLATLLLVFLIGRELASAGAGLWAATFVALAPGHILHAGQIRVDVTATTLVTLTALLAVRLIGRSPGCERPRPWFLLGLSAGLAMAAKYSVVLIVTAIVAVSLGRVRFRWPPLWWSSAGAFLGFVAGEPFILTNGLEVIRQVGRLIQLSQQIPADVLIPKPTLIGQHLADLARFSLGLPVALLAAWGVWHLARRRSSQGWLLPLALAAGLAGLIPQNWPLLRYQLPLLPLCAVAAAVALQRMPVRSRWAVGLLASATALAASTAQLYFRTAPHPINLALSAVHREVPPGEPVARIMPEVPPLDDKVYPMGPNPFMDDLTRDPPRWVVTADLPIGEYPGPNQHFLQTKYDQIAVFRTPRHFSWATLGETGAPHDWKYTHPRLALYRLR